MKAKLIVEGKEFEVNINHPELEKLIKPPKGTGYERVGNNTPYCFVDADGTLNGYDAGEHEDVDNVYYNEANYYSEVVVAENNARADKLMRQLRRFAVERRTDAQEWGVKTSPKWFIEYDYDTGKFDYIPVRTCRDFGTIYFESDRACELAVEIFHDELIWYFTEYKDSL